MRKKKSSKNKLTKNKVLKIILISLVVFTLIFLCILLYFARLVFDSEQSYDTTPLTQKHIFHQGKIIQRLTNLLYKSKPGRVCVLVLSQAEVNAIIAAVSNSDSLKDLLLSSSLVGNAPRKRPYKVIFKNNRFDIKYSFPVDFNTPFGKNINLTLSGKPAINRKGVHIDIKSISAGALPLPPRQVEYILHSLLSEYEKDEIFKQIHEVIVKAYITPDNNLVIYFYPYRIKNSITKWF